MSSVTLPAVRGGQSLNSATATANPTTGATFPVPSNLENYSLQVKYNGSPTGLTVNLMGSLNGTDFMQLAQWVQGTQNNGDIVFVTGKCVAVLRADISAGTGLTSGVNAWVSTT